MERSRIANLFVSIVFFSVDTIFSRGMGQVTWPFWLYASGNIFEWAPYPASVASKSDFLYFCTFFIDYCKSRELGS